MTPSPRSCALLAALLPALGTFGADGAEPDATGFQVLAADCEPVNVQILVSSDAEPFG